VFGVPEMSEWGGLSKCASGVAVLGKRFSTQFGRHPHLGTVPKAGGACTNWVPYKSAIKIFSFFSLT
jgi:hypothetical protein